MENSFYSLVLRMKYINRWSLMKNTRYETLSEHSLDVAVLAHALAVIGKKRFSKDVDPNQVAVIAMFHDANEIITGDLPTPIKYHDKDITKAYKSIESMATNRLLECLPDDLKQEYSVIMKCECDEYVTMLVKAADKISALIKCVDEEQTGNKEFVKAKEATLKSLNDLNIQEVNVFMDEFFGSFLKTIDEQ